MRRIFSKYYFSIVGFVVGIANGLFGSGGGMIAVPALEKGGMKPKNAHATSIAVTLALSLTSGFVYFLNGNINIKESLKFVPMGIVGAIIGTVLLKRISNNILKKVFGILMIYSGIRILIMEA